MLDGDKSQAQQISRRYDRVRIGNRYVNLFASYLEKCSSETLSSSYDFQIFGFIKLETDKKFQFVIDIGFTSKFPDQGFHFNRQLLLKALRERIFIDKLFTALTEKIEHDIAEGVNHLKLFIEINSDRAPKLRVGLGFSSSGITDVCHKSEAFDFPVDFKEGGMQAFDDKVLEAYEVITKFVKSVFVIV